MVSIPEVTKRRGKQDDRRTTVTSRFATIDDYIGSFPKDVQVVLESVRETIRHAAPTGDETISYQIPTIRLNGRYILSFAAWKHHVGLYPLPAVDAALEQELAPYRAAKATVRFPLREPIPYELIERLVALRIEQQSENGERKR